MPGPIPVIAVTKPLPLNKLQPNLWFRDFSAKRKFLALRSCEDIDLLRGWHGTEHK